MFMNHLNHPSSEQSPQENYGRILFRRENYSQHEPDNFPHAVTALIPDCPPCLLVDKDLGVYAIRKTEWMMNTIHERTVQLFRAISFAGGTYLTDEAYENLKKAEGAKTASKELMMSDEHSATHDFIPAIQDEGLTGGIVGLQIGKPEDSR